MKPEKILELLNKKDPAAYKRAYAKGWLPVAFKELGLIYKPKFIKSNITYEEAHDIVMPHNLKSRDAYWEAKKNGMFAEIPHGPDKFFENKGWTGWSMFLLEKETIRKKPSKQKRKPFKRKRRNTTIQTFHVFKKERNISNLNNIKVEDYLIKNDYELVHTEYLNDTKYISVAKNIVKEKQIESHVVCYGFINHERNGFAYKILIFKHTLK